MKEKRVWEDDAFYLVRHESSIPWLILHPKEKYREFSEMSRELRCRIVDLLTAIEEEMLAYCRPEKINIASFGNYLPRQHWHIMARFKEDSHFPEPMWGERQREGKLELPDFETFAKRLKRRLEQTTSG
jgi:diadenosine tetraphosphate (Ap4A) HIT family hydrolase